MTANYLDLHWNTWFSIYYCNTFYAALWNEWWVHLPVRVIFFAIVWNFLFGRRVWLMLNSPFSIKQMIKGFHQNESKHVISFVTEVSVTGFWRGPTDLEISQQLPILFFNKDFRIEAFVEGTSELIFGLWEYEDVQVRDCSLNLPSCLFWQCNIKNSFYYNRKKNHCVIWRVSKRTRVTNFHHTIDNSS